MALNIFRTEVLLGLWLIRVVARFAVRSWRDSFPGPGSSLPWATMVADRQEARDSILQLSYFGMSALCVLGILAFGVPARLLGFPVIFTFLGYLAALAPCAVVAVAHLTVQRTLSLAFDIADPPPAGESPWELDVEKNPRAFLGVSLWGLSVSVVVALALTAWLPHPFTWAPG
ncbi:hypothetical protein [Promicromonospora sp. NPDC019610]|uniref:hypothetical protein n=1 Tax=Promicromonospora sp. NPDC019610 TaxID=3364405 RepID=UPI00378B3AD1